ncbi:MAG: tetratricopeptide repeat protein [Myxococcota bacterium]|jgi:TolA-binding protein|nr:tetratricopeptide repeat protein [Myxococcota bacterium]
MDGPSELREIKKEIIESRGLIIKSNNLANALSAEVRSIAKRQTSYERRLTWNSVGTYFLVAVAIWVGLHIVYSQRQGSLTTALEKEKTKVEEAQKALATIKAERGEAKERPGREALDSLLSLVESKERQAAIEAYGKIDSETLTPIERKLLDSAILSFRNDLSMQHYTRGLELVGGQKFAEAVEALRTALEYRDEGGHSTSAKLQLADSLRLLGKPREAIAILQRLLEEQVDRELADDAYWYLALAYEDAHQKDEARSVLRSLMRQYPDSQYVRAARVRVAEIQLKMYKDE